MVFVLRPYVVISVLDDWCSACFSCLSSDLVSYNTSTLEKAAHDPPKITYTCSRLLNLVSLNALVTEKILPFNQRTVLVLIEDSDRTTAYSLKNKKYGICLA